MVTMRIKADRTAEVNLPMNGAADNVTHLKVYLMHYNKRYSLSLVGIELKVNEYGLGIDTESHSIFDPRQQRITLEAAPRYSAKRFGEIVLAVENSINQQYGVVWDKIVAAAEGWNGTFLLAEEKADEAVAA